MKWFKHMTRMWSDPKIAKAVEESGIEVYGLYCRLLELIAGNLEDSTSASCTYSLKRWSRECGLLSTRFSRLAQVLAKSQLILLEPSEQDLKVEIPNIIKYRDEYSEKRDKAKTKCRESVGTISGECRDQNRVDKSRIDKEEIPIPNATISETKPPAEKPSRFSDDDMMIANGIFSAIKTLSPSMKTPNLNAWANEIRLMRERDHRTHEEISALFRWANNDDFWKANILSPGKLREKWDQLTIQKNNNAPKKYERKPGEVVL